MSGGRDRSLSGALRKKADAAAVQMTYSFPKSRVPMSLALLAFTSLVLTCACAGSERAENAGATKPGTTATALVSEVGPPTIDRPIKVGSVADPCADDQRNVRAFEYHVGLDPVTGTIAKFFDRPTVMAKTTVCFDKDTKVTSTHFAKLN
jgi:hypothetical protein